MQNHSTINRIKVVAEDVMSKRQYGSFGCSVLSLCLANGHFGPNYPGFLVLTLLTFLRDCGANQSKLQDIVFL